MVASIQATLGSVLNETDAYREWDPPRAWSGMVACLWEQQATVEREQRVVPDGCADVIVSIGAGKAVGLADGPMLYRLPAGWACRGLRLRPEAVAMFFGVPAEQLRNLDVPLDDVVGTARARRLVDTVLHGRPDAALTSVPPEPVRQAIRLLRSGSVDQCAAALGLSSRHLRRLVVAHSGLGPKSYQRVVRLRRFLADHRPLAQAAIAAGYADQAHLTREVTRMCGLPPAALRAERAS